MFYKDYLPVMRHDDLCALTDALLWRLIWGQHLYFLLVIINLQVKLLMNLRATVKVFI